MRLTTLACPPQIRACTGPALRPRYVFSRTYADGSVRVGRECPFIQNRAIPCVQTPGASIAGSIVRSVALSDLPTDLHHCIALAE